MASSVSEPSWRFATSSGRWAYVRFSASSPEFERLALHMSELGEKIGGGDDLLRALLPLARHYFNRGEPLRALALAKRSLRLTEATQDPSLLAEVRAMLGTLAYSCGNLREALSHSEDVAVYIEQTNPSFFIGPFQQRIILPNRARPAHDVAWPSRRGSQTG